MVVIEVHHVSKIFRGRRGGKALLGRGGLGELFRGRYRTDFAALSDIDFEVRAGESLGLIGANGSGKSTLLKILAGVTVPTDGDVIVRGRVASLLELGAGFHPMLTGRENVYLNAGILGMRHAQVDNVFDEIIDFSGIGDFIDNPVDTYSSGMYIRIAFAVAAFCNPDIFLIDEVLSVGDEAFQRKCRVKIGELREQGKTIVFVSHDLGIVNAMCDRVVLLSRGKMLTRRTPQETINFYLRQVGRDTGVHTFRQGDLEIIFCQGRIAIYHKENETTAAAGLQVMIQCMGEQYSSTNAEWQVVERHEDRCVARGRMLRMPVYHVWDMRIVDGQLQWHVSLEVERDLTVELINAISFFPVAYSQWLYSDLAGHFPEILPDDLQWSTVVPAEQGCCETAILPDAASPLPPVVATLEPHQPHTAFHWSNTDYMTGTRALNAEIRIPDATESLESGTHEIMSLTFDLTMTPETARQRAREQENKRILRHGKLTAKFERGSVALAWDGEELSTYLHVYSSALIGNLWVDSMTLKWDAAHLESGRLEVSGESRRFPFRQEWELEEVEDGIALRIWLEALEAFDVQEYHVSAVLRPEYESWETAHEHGTYPDFTLDWKHANSNYAPGPFGRALCPTLPSVTLDVRDSDIPFRMTAINTAAYEQARVIQALRTGEGGKVHFSKGRHLYFRGVIKAEESRH